MTFPRRNQTHLQLNHPLAWVTLLGLGLICLAPGKVCAEKPLLLWHAYRAAERAALEATVEIWNTQAHGKDPQIQLLAVPYDAFPDKITAAIPRGHGPDLFIFAHDRVGDWAESKVIEPIEFWMTEAHADQFIFKTIDALCYQDSLFGLPLAFKSTALFFNKDLVPHPPTTTDELLTLGRKLTDPAQGRFGLVYDNLKLYFHAPWLFGAGGHIFDEKGQLQVATKQAVEALKLARLMGGPGGIVPPESSATLTTSLFNKGQAALAISGPWILGELAPTLKFGVVPLPIISSSGKPAAPFLGAEGIMMSTRCTQKAAAFRAMTFLTSDAMAIKRAREARQPVANQQAWKDPQVSQDQILQAFRAQLNSAVVMPGTPEMRVVWSPYDMALQKVVGNGSPALPALQEAETEIRRFLGTLRKQR